MFGEPDAEGRRPGFDAVLEARRLVGGYTDDSCVPYAASLDD